MATSPEDEDQQARQIGLNYLSGRARTIHEVREKLRKEEFSATVIDRAVEDLKRLNLLDDREFARRWIESRVEGKRPAGGRKFAQDLGRKGIAPGIITQVLEEFKEDIESESAAMNLLSQQWWRYDELDEHKAKRRMMGLLARRGYQQELALKAVEQVWEEKQRNDLEGD